MNIVLNIDVFKEIFLYFASVGVTQNVITLVCFWKSICQNWYLAICTSTEMDFKVK